MTMYLSGGGRVAANGTAIERFVRDAHERAERRPEIVVVAEGNDADRVGRELAEALLAAGAGRAGVAHGSPDELREHLLRTDALAVVGEGARALLDRLEPAVVDLRRLVSEGVPYLGVGAGAAIAGEHAVYGGHRVDGVPVAPETASGGVAEVEAGEGLALVDLAIDVGGAPAGALGRLLAIVESGAVDRGLAIDEGTALVVADGSLGVVGSGSVWQARLDEEAGTVEVASVRGEA